MRYVIIGAGAVGGTIGVRLGEAGHDVTLVARGAHLDAIRRRGLTLRTPDRTATWRGPATDAPGERPLPADTVLVLTVKSQDTPAALADWADAPVAGGGTAGERLPLFTAQNGVANEPAALRLFARGVGSTEVDHLNGEIVLLGRLHGVPTPANAAVAYAVRRAARERIPAGGFPPAELAKMIG
ncbi:ketopantoate reductase family protein [Micromonospora sp. L32]|uniref:ketopantoate reductase family protein n=1 Tax=Micromonospora sp. L32 TaxID=3452214 RepID=UPI003F8B4B9C